MNQNIEPSLIIAVLSFIGVVISAIIQFIKDRISQKTEKQKIEVEATKAGMEVVSNIADIVLKMNKQEIETLRQICDDLRVRNEYLEKQLTTKQLTIEEKEKIIEELEEDLKTSKKAGEKCHDLVEEYKKLIEDIKQCPTTDEGDKK